MRAAAEIGSGGEGFDSRDDYRTGGGDRVIILEMWFGQRIILSVIILSFQIGCSLAGVTGCGEFRWAVALRAGVPCG